MEKFQEIVAAATKVTLLGDGDATRADLDAALELAPLLLCADGGVNRALDWGLSPRAVIGDADSMDAARVAAAGIPKVDAEDQDFPDFDKALRLIGARLTLAVGFLGGRLDHQLAAITALSRAPGPVILIGSDCVAAMIPRRIALSLPAGTRVSMWPLVPSRGQSRGLRWPIDGLVLDPQGRVGTSNAATGGVMDIVVTEGEMLLMLPRDRLEILAAALAD